MYNNEGTSPTKEELRRKRRRVARKRVVAGIWALIKFVFFGCILIGLIIGGYFVANWGWQKYQEVADMYAGYLERQQQTRGVIEERFTDYTNVLVLGIDDEVNIDDIPERRADAILLVSLDNRTGDVRIINIPRDTLIEMPLDKNRLKLGTIYSLGGPTLMLRTVNQLLGISIHQYVVVDMIAMTKLIDTMGGIDLYIEHDMDYDDPESGLAIHMKQGYRHLDGEGAEHYLRYRGGDLGDLGRTQRQQKFVKALYEKILTIETLAKLPDLIEVFQQNIVTSAEVFDSADLGNVIMKLSNKPPRTIVLPGVSPKEDATIWIMDREKTDSMIEELFPPTAKEDEGN